MANGNPSRKDTSAEHKKNLAMSADVLSRHFRKWAMIFPNHPATKETVAFYLEALSDLTPEQIDLGCAQAIKTAEQFPKPGHIRAAVPVVHEMFLGPRRPKYLDEPPTSEAERMDALEFSSKLREKLKLKRM